MPYFQSSPPSLPPFPLFDCHVHLGPSDTGEVYYPTLTGEEYRTIMDEAGIEQACAFAPTRTDGYRDANHDLRDWADVDTNGIRAFARLGGPHVALNEPQLWVLRKKASHWLRGTPPDLDDLHELKQFDGVKLLPHLDGLPDRDTFARISELRLPVLVHGGEHSPPHWIETEIVPRVQGPLIIAHLGAFPCDASMLNDAIGVAERHPHVYLDTSGAWVSGFVEHAVDRVPQKLIFGSDAPLAHPLVAWQHVASVIPNRSSRERIGRGAAAEIFDDYIPA